MPDSVLWLHCVGWLVYAKYLSVYSLALAYFYGSYMNLAAASWQAACLGVFQGGKVEK